VLAILAREPADISASPPRFEIAAERTTQEINQHVVILHSSLVVSNHALIHPASADPTTNPVSSRASRTTASRRVFAAFEDAARERPLAKQRRLSAADEQDTIDRRRDYRQ